MIFSSLLHSAVRSIWPRPRQPCASDWSLVARVRETASTLAGLPDPAISERVAELRRGAHAPANVPDDDTIVEAFALATEAARRVLQIDLYDVQLLGGLALTRGAIAEMQTGEGKTFVAMLPAVVHALGGKGVHVMTVNPYLAKRDFDLLMPVYSLLGLSAGLIEPGLHADAKRAVYECDVTYGAGYEFGFDYLRDQTAMLVRRPPQLGEAYLRQLRRTGEPEKPKPVQRSRAAAIIDEADSVMLDEATTPLILSAGGGASLPDSRVFHAAACCARELERGIHYALDESNGGLWLTESGVQYAMNRLKDSPGLKLERPWPHYVEQAVRADCLFHRDVHYVVEQDKILLVDQHTGRIVADRSWRDGLQQAVQAKENVAITTETQSVARITRQRFLRSYRHMCGMTGTAQGSEKELCGVYRASIVVIPPHRPCARTSCPPRFFTNAASKERAIVEEVQRLHQTRRPILIGTATIETSRRLADALAACGVSCRLLNGLQDTEEATIIAEAGELDAVTIATNMAGRGTDIKLGPGVAELGGLHVIAAEPQHSSRVDRQLFGRAARQGDPGSCQLFASAEDRLFLDEPQFVPAHLVAVSGEVMRDYTAEIARAQKRAEQDAAEIRSRMYRRDDWLESVLDSLAAPA